MNRRYSAFMAAEVAIGLVLLGVLASALLLALNTQDKLDARIHDRRRAIESAESALLLLQSRQQPDLGPDAKLVVHDLRAEGTDKRWVRVSVTVGRDSCDLVGLVPAAEQGGRP